MPLMPLPPLPAFGMFGQNSSPPAVIRPSHQPSGPGAVLVVPGWANPGLNAPNVPNQPNGRLVIQPYGPVPPGTPGFVVPVR